MKAIGGRIFVKDLQSKNHTWKSLILCDCDKHDPLSGETVLCLHDKLIKNLVGLPLKWEHPSLFQCKAIPEFISNRE